MAVVCKFRLESVSDPEYFGPQVEVRGTWWFEDSVTQEKLSKDFQFFQNYMNPADVTSAAILTRVSQEAKQIKDLAVASNAIQSYIGGTYNVSLT